MFSEKKLDGKKAIVTAGPSIEKIDQIRYLSNFSSGLQGYLIAEVLSNFGAENPYNRALNIRSTPNVISIPVEAGADFLKKSIENLPADIFISVAAISDWKSKRIVKDKIKKNNLKSISFNFTRKLMYYNKFVITKKDQNLSLGFLLKQKIFLNNSKKNFCKRVVIGLLLIKYRKNQDSIQS